MDITKSFKTHFKKSTGWCDYEVVSCDGWFFSALENFGTYSENRREELINLFLEVKHVGCKGKTTAAAIYVDFLKETNDNLDLFDMFFKITKEEFFSYSPSSSEHRFLYPLFSFFVSLMEESEEKSLLERKILVKLYQSKSYDFIKDISYYCEYNAWTIQTKREEGGLSQSLKKNLTNKISRELKFLSEELQKQLLDTIYDDCLHRLQINFKREKDYNNEFLRSVNYTYEDSINKTIRDFLV